MFLQFLDAQWHMNAYVIEHLMTVKSRNLKRTNTKYRWSCMRNLYLSILTFGRGNLTSNSSWSFVEMTPKVCEEMEFLKPKSWIHQLSKFFQPYVPGVGDLTESLCSLSIEYFYSKLPSLSNLTTFLTILGVPQVRLVQ